MYFNLALPLLVFATFVMPRNINPGHSLEIEYEREVRSTLNQFHINLSNGNPDANGPMTSPDIEWNFNGALTISSEAFVATLKGILATFGQVHLTDQYQLVDGNVGAVLYHLHGQSVGDFAGVEATGEDFNVMGSELMVFDSDAKLNHLYTMDELDQIVAQVTDSKPAYPTSNNTLFGNVQTSPEYRQKLRDNMALLFTYFREGQYTEMGSLAASNVAINADGTISSGTQAFTQLFTANQDTFPNKVFHVDYLIADGTLGAVECVWQGIQTGPYTTSAGRVIEPTGKSVRVRNLVFFEFDDEGLIDKATWVHNEGAVEQQLLENQKEVLFPLYP